MDKYEYKVRSEEISKLIDKERYAEAVKIADTIDWRRVKSAAMLLKIAALYRVSRRNEDSKEMLMLAYERYPTNRSVVYSLCELSIELDDVVAAIEYYKQFAKLAPKDNGVYTLRYRILEAQEASLEERIEILEELKKKDYQEEWAYELAYLYHRVGLSTKCVEECDDIILWFGDGPYVMKAMELKAKHVPLTAMQQQNYEIMLGNAGQNYSSGNYDTENYDSGSYDGQDYGAEDYAGQNYDSNGYVEQDYNADGYAEQDYGADGYAEQDYNADGYGEQNYNSESYDEQNYNSDGYTEQNYGGAGYDGQDYGGAGYDRQDYGAGGYDGQNYGTGSYDTQNYNGENYDTQGYDAINGDEQSYGESAYGIENDSNEPYGDGYEQQNYGNESYGNGYGLESDPNGQYTDADYGQQGYADGQGNYSNEQYAANGYGQEDYPNGQYAQSNYVDDGYGNLSYVDGSNQDNGYTSEFYVEQTYDENGNLITPEMYTDSDYIQGESTQASPPREYRNGLHLVENTAPPAGNSGDMSQYNTINLQKVVAESMRELFPDDNEDVFAEDREKYNSGADIGSTAGDTRIFTGIADLNAVKAKSDESTGSQSQTGRINIAQMVTGVSEKAPEPHTGAIKKVFVPGDDARTIKSDSDIEELRDTTERSVDEEHNRMEYNDENVYHEQSIMGAGESDEASQTTGPMKLDEVLVEWERMKQDNAKKHQEEIKKRVLTQTGKIFADFDNSIKSGILGELEREEAEAEREHQTSISSSQGNNSTNRAMESGDGFLDADVTGDIPQLVSEDDFDVEYVTEYQKKPKKAQESTMVEKPVISAEVGQTGERERAESNLVASETPGIAAGEKFIKAAAQENDQEVAANYETGESVEEAYDTAGQENDTDTRKKDPAGIENCDIENTSYIEEVYAENAVEPIEEMYAENADEPIEEMYAENTGKSIEEACAEADVESIGETYPENVSEETGEVHTETVGKYPEAPYAENTDEYAEASYAENTDGYAEASYAENAGEYTEELYAENAGEYTEERYAENAGEYTEELYAEATGEYTEELYVENAGEYTGEAYMEDAGEYTGVAYAQNTGEYTEKLYAEDGDQYTEEIYVEDADIPYEEDAYRQEDAGEYAGTSYIEDTDDDLEDAYSESADDSRYVDRRRNDQYNEEELDPEDAESIAEMAKEDALKTQEIKMNTADLSALSEKIVATTKKEASGAKREEIRDFTPEEQTLFENFAVTKKIKKQIIYALENMTLAAYTGNVIITGDAGLDTVRMAKNLVKEYQASDEGFSGKLAKITGEKINQRNIKDIFEKLNNGGIIIEKANGMSEEKLYELATNLNQDTLGIVVIMEDTKKEITKLLEKQAMIVDYFNIRIDLMEMDNNALVAYAKNYALALEYSIDELGTLALYTRIANMQSGNHVVTKDEVRDIIDEAIWKSKKSKIKNFVDVLFARRYDNEDMIVLKERDFM